MNEISMSESLKRVSENVQLIYSRIADDVSRRVFENRLMMALTKFERNDYLVTYLRERRNRDRRLAELFDEIRKADGDIFIYGAGECGRYIYGRNLAEGIPVQGFIDNREWHKEIICNLPVYRFEDAVQSCRKATIILSIESYAARRQIKRQIEQTESDWTILDAGSILWRIDKEAAYGLASPYYGCLYDLVDTNVIASEVFSRIMEASHPTAYQITLNSEDIVGKMIKEKYGSCPWCCYLMDDKIQNEYNGIPVYTYGEAFSRYHRLDVVAVSAHGSRVIRDQMEAYGIQGECINLADIMEELERRQYFDFFRYAGTRETFVDGGVFDLGSTKAFMTWCNGNYEKIYAFEPEQSNYELCKEKTEQLNNVSLFNCGLFDKQGKIGFTAGLGGASRIENQQQDFYPDYEIAVTDLDSVVQGENVTFIKMDIEGAEGKALLGAKRIITEQKPKLAICVYHKQGDIIELPALVLELRPDYKIAFRHYSLMDTETVMYAW